MNASTMVRPADHLRRQVRRAQRLHAQSILWDVSGMERQRDCGRVGVMPLGAVRVRASGAGAGRVAGLHGVATCGSVWTCPVCSARILGHRQGELESGAQHWAADGGSVAMVTLTMRHQRGQSLRLLWDSLSAGWRKVVQSRQWKDARAMLGAAGYCRVTEVTHGKHGWHVHVHVAIFFRAGSPVDQAVDRIEAAKIVDVLGVGLFDPWVTGVTSRGLAAPLLRSGGMDARLWQPADGGVLSCYFTKQTYSTDATHLAMELARGDVKAARGGNRTPFRILSDFAELGVADDLDLWHEWERGSKGRRQMTWSRDMRELLGLADVELTDEELASAETGTSDDDLVELPAASWARICRAGLRALVLEAAEDDTDGTLLRWHLDRLEVPYLDVRPRVST